MYSWSEIIDRRNCKKEGDENGQKAECKKQKDRERAHIEPIKFRHVGDRIFQSKLSNDQKQQLARSNAIAMFIVRPVAINLVLIAPLFSMVR